MNADTQYVNSKVETIKSLCAESGVKYLNHNRGLASSLSVYRTLTSTSVTVTRQGETGETTLFGPSTDAQVGLFLMGLEQGIRVALNFGPTSEMSE